MDIGQESEVPGGMMGTFRWLKGRWGGVWRMRKLRNIWSDEVAEQEKGKQQIKEWWSNKNNRVMDWKTYKKANKKQMWREERALE